jgi:hypothetical protein
MSTEAEADAIQRILRDLVEREVIYNVSYLMYELSQVCGDIPYNKDREINDENIRELLSAQATYLEAVEYHGGYNLVEHEGEFYWYEDGDPVPFKDVPKGHVVKAVTRRKGNPGWAWKEEGDDEWTGRHDTREEAIAEAWVRGIGLTAFDTEEEAAENCCEENRIERSEYDHEVYEHWIVTGHLGRKLKEQGEHVVEFCNMTIWGRCCTGQAISMDGVIESIARSMEILPGMQYDWSKKG